MNSPLNSYLVGDTEDILGLVENDNSPARGADLDHGHAPSSCNLAGSSYSLTGKRTLSEAIEEGIEQRIFHNQQIPYVDDTLSLIYDDVTQVDIGTSNIEHARIGYDNRSDVGNSSPSEITEGQPTFSSTVEHFARGHDFVLAKPQKKARLPQSRQLRAPKPDSIPWEEW